MAGSGDVGALPAYVLGRNTEHIPAALGNYSHAEGDGCTAGGIGSHAEGFATLSQGDYSHTQGLRTFAFNSYEAAFGKFNKSLNEEDISHKTVFSIDENIQ